MDKLSQWVELEGTEGRRRLFKALRAKYPKFSQVRMTDYIKGQRIPDFEIAQIIAQVTGIPIFLLTFRFVHRP